MQSTGIQYPFKSKEDGFGLFLTEQFNNFVSYAYHGLLHVFRYLTVQELMAAAGVCKLWRDLALHHSHVRSSHLFSYIYIHFAYRKNVCNSSGD